MKFVTEENKGEKFLKDGAEEESIKIEGNDVKDVCLSEKDDHFEDEEIAQDSSQTPDDEIRFDKDEYIYNKLVKKRNHVYSCIANVLKNYDQQKVLDAFIPEREKIAMKLAAVLMTKDGLSITDFSNISTSTSEEDDKVNEIVNLSAINFLINQVYSLSAAKNEGLLEFSKEAKDHLTSLALHWAKLRDQAFMFSNGMIKLEYELHEELHFIETELYHETERKLKSIGIDSKTIASSKLKELRDQRRKASNRTIYELIDMVKSWHSEIAFLRRITEFYASMRQLNEEEIEAISILFENFSTIMDIRDLKKLFKEISINTMNSLQKKRDQLNSTDKLRLLIYETIMKFSIGEENVPYFLCRRLIKDEEEYLQIPIISLLLFARFCNSYSETTRSKKAHDLELIVSEVANLSGWDIVDQNVEILSEGDTVTEIDLIIRRGKMIIIIEVKDLALWRGWYFDRESLTKRYDIFVTAVKKLRERRLLLKNTEANIVMVTALTERWKRVDGVPIIPLKSLHKYLMKLKRVESKRKKPRR